MSFSSPRSKNKQTSAGLSGIARELTLPEAKKKLMDLVARRDHSEKELRKKLLLKTTAEVVEQTIQWAHEQNWLASPEKLTEQFSAQLSRRGKGIRKINQKLKELGLKQVKADQDDELAKARRLIANKWTSEDLIGLDFKEAQKLKAKMMRYLASRGFESQIIMQILKNDFKSTDRRNEEELYDEEF